MVLSSALAEYVVICGLKCCQGRNWNWKVPSAKLKCTTRGLRQYSHSLICCSLIHFYFAASSLPFRSLPSNCSLVIPSFVLIANCNPGLLHNLLTWSLSPSAWYICRANCLSTSISSAICLFLNPFSLFTVPYSLSFVCRAHSLRRGQLGQAARRNLGADMSKINLPESRPQ